MIDITPQSNVRLRHGARPWRGITGITLHQTACVLGERADRYRTLQAHAVVTAGGHAMLVHPLDTVVWHGNGYNRTDVGLEIDGRFEGVEGNPATLWQPRGQAVVPSVLSQAQLVAAREAVTWICAEVERHGGRVRYVHAHRQSSGSRRSDPGSLIWREVGLWSIATLGLVRSEGAIGTGLPIPEAWDPSRVGVLY